MRYAESDGFRIDDYRPHAWRYRDYVIGAFNNDKPYDRFVSEQIAGDEITPGDPEARVATGFLRHWLYGTTIETSSANGTTSLMILPT